MQITMITRYLACTNGDVKLVSSKTPMIFWSGRWAPICRTFFSNIDSSGTELFCKELGYASGVSIIGSNKKYKVDSFFIGKCEETDEWPNCSGGHNVMEVGGQSEGFSCTRDQTVGMAIRCNGGVNTTASTSCTGKY